MIYQICDVMMSISIIILPIFHSVKRFVLCCDQLIRTVQISDVKETRNKKLHLPEPLFLLMFQAVGL